MSFTTATARLACALGGAALALLACHPTSSHTPGVGGAPVAATAVDASAQLPLLPYPQRVALTEGTLT